MSKPMSKSLAELDAAADALLKSEAANTDEEMSPEDVSSNAAPASDKKEEEKENEVEKSGANGDNLEKGEGCSDCKKSEDEDDEAEEAEPIAKSEEADTEDAAEDEDEEEADDEAEPNAEEIEKSLTDDFQANEVVADAVANSEFAAAVVEVITKSLAEIQYDVQANGKGSAQSSDVLAKSMQAVLNENQALRSENERLTRRVSKLEKSIDMGFEKVMDALDEISTQPVSMRKSLGSINVQERDFAKSIGAANQPGGFESLSKSQVMDILMAEMLSGNPQVTQQDIIGYESGAPLASNLQSLVASKSSR